MNNFNWRFLLGICIVAAYLSISYMVLFTDVFKGGALSDTIRIVFGVLLGVYGIWRGYRLWKDKN
jgi:hypothetical protein